MPSIQLLYSDSDRKTEADLEISLFRNGNIQISVQHYENEFVFTLSNDDLKKIAEEAVFQED